MAVITQTAGHLNTGRDIQINLVGGSGGDAETNAGATGLVTTISNITRFEYNAEYIDLKATTITSTTALAKLPRYWKGSIEYIRSDDNVDTLVNNIERNWYTTGQYTNGLMYVTITEPGGGSVNMQFLDVAVALEDGGTYDAEQFVKVRLTWEASQRIM